MQPRRRPDVLFQDLADGSAVLVDPVSGSTHALNATGAAIWRLCDGRRDTAAIVRSLRRRFEAPAAEIGEGVEALLEHFAELHVLAEVPAEQAHVAHYDMLGYRVRVESTSAEYLETLGRLNAFFRVPAPAAGDDTAQPVGFYEALLSGKGAPWEVTFQGEELSWHATLYKAVTSVEFHMCELAIAGRPDLAHVHSAALATAQGSLLLPGTSGIGKTTFALALALRGRERGLRLLSDDVVFIRPETLELESFPRQFHVHEDALARLEPLGLRYAPEDHIGAHLCSTVLGQPGEWDRSPGPPIRWVVFPRLEPRGEITLEEISKAEAAVEVMRFSKNIRRFPNGGARWVSRLLEGAACYRLTRNDDLEGAADVLIDLVNRQSG